MANIASGMKSLCEDIIKSDKERKHSLVYLKDASRAIRGDTRMYVGLCRKGRHAMAKDLKKELSEKRRELSKTVRALRGDGRRQQGEIRSDVTEASRAWKDMAAALNEKRGGKP